MGEKYPYFASRERDVVEAKTYEEQCGSLSTRNGEVGNRRTGGWICTRPKGHKGLHQAGIGKVSVAEWADDGMFEQFDDNDEPYPEIEAEEDLDDVCDQPHPRAKGECNWYCTRKRGHKGLHMAGSGDGERLYAWWTDVKSKLPQHVEEGLRALGL